MGAALAWPAWALATGALLAACWAVCGRLLRLGPATGAAACVACAAALLLLEMLWGAAGRLAFGTVGPSALLLAGAGFLAVLARRPAAAAGPPAGGAGPLAPAAWPRLSPRTGLAAWAVAVVAARVGALVLAAVLDPPGTWASLGSHLPIMVEWLRRGTLLAAGPPLWYRPGNSDLLAAWFLLPFGNDTLAGLYNVAVAAAFAATLWTLAGVAGLRAEWRVLYVAWFLGTGVVGGLLGTSEDDLALAWLFAASVTFLLARRSGAGPARPLSAMAVLAAAVMAGTRLDGAYYLALLVLVVRVDGERHLVRQALLAAPVVAVFLGFWLVRDRLVALGAPPLAADLDGGVLAWLRAIGTSLAFHLDPATLGAFARDLVAGAGWWAALGVPCALGWLWRRWRGLDAGGTGATVAGVCLIALFACALTPGTGEVARAGEVVRPGLPFAVLAGLLLALTLQAAAAGGGRWATALVALGALTAASPALVDAPRQLLLGPPALAGEAAAALAVAALWAAGRAGPRWRPPRPGPAALAAGALAAVLVAGAGLDAARRANLARRPAYWGGSFHTNVFAFLDAHPMPGPALVYGMPAYPFLGDGWSREVCYEGGDWAGVLVGTGDHGRWTQLVTARGVRMLVVARTGATWPNARRWADADPGFRLVYGDASVRLYAVATPAAAGYHAEVPAAPRQASGRGDSKEGVPSLRPLATSPVRGRRDDST